MPLDERATAPPNGRSREDEIAALTAQLRGMLLRGFGTLTMILVAVLGFFGTHLWTTVDRDTQELGALSASVAVLNVSVGALRERLDLSVGELRERLDLTVAALRERMDLQFATLTKDLDRTRSELLQALAGSTGTR